MEDFFLLLYSGEDNHPKLRILTECGLGDEMFPEEAPYFQENRICLRHKNSFFYTYHPIGATEKMLDFRDILPCGILCTSAGSPAWKMFKEMPQDIAIGVFHERQLNVIQWAMTEKQAYSLH